MPLEAQQNKEPSNPTREFGVGILQASHERRPLIAKPTPDEFLLKMHGARARVVQIR